jgi:hypothetical protein
MFGSFMDSVVNTVDDFVDDPIGVSVNIATQPLRDALEVVDGLTEGELRHKAAIRLGTDVAGGMALSELLDWYAD